MPTPRLLFAFVVTLLTACASTPHRESGSAAPGTQLTVVYSRPGAGMGHTPIPGVAVVPVGRHPPLVAMLSLQRAMARFQAQVKTPDVVALKDGDNDLRWESDIGPLLAEQLASYRQVPTRPRLQDRLFGVRFAGRLLIIDNEMRFSIESRIFNRGAGEAWRELDPKDYDGSPFGAELSAALKQELLTAASR